jgi:dienelactone hydrolase
VLALAYFKEPGLPQQLENIPLEYFARALKWLGRQPQVDAKHIAVLGVSRGSETALLSGVYFPGLVHAVIAMVPSDAALCSYPGCQGPTWTLRGHALPYTREFDNPQPTDQPAAVIPVQRIRGPVFLACGAEDQTWTSCPYSDAIIAHLDASHDRFPHVLYSYAKAGHAVGTLAPYEPLALNNSVNLEADEQAHEADWPRLLRFLAALSRSP